MIQYAINSIICSGLLFLLYKLLLESEKMHVFKRFFLLLSVVVSLTAPLITLSFASSPEENIVLPFISKEPVHFIYKPSPIPVTEESNYLFLFLTVAYLAGVALNLLRFGKRVAYFFKVQSNKEQLVLEQARLVLVDEQVIPHSFLNSIFLNKEHYRKGLIEPEILVHELAHVRQLHSLDILFAQLIQCVFWFNPFFIYYIKAIQLNHEFLADGAAASSSPNPLYYQQLLLTKASTNPKFSLASQFNFFNH